MKGLATVFNFSNISNFNTFPGFTCGNAETVMKLFDFYRDETHTNILTSQEHLESPSHYTHDQGTQQAGG